MWLDTWEGPGPLWERFQPLYQIAVHPNISVAAALASPGAVAFNRPLVDGELDMWQSLQHILEQTTLSPEADQVSWDLTASHKFLVKSLYDRLAESPSLDTARGLWKAPVPMKIKFFLWPVLRDRLPSATNVAKRNDPSNGRCSLCDLQEDANHTFFKCPLA